LLRSLTEIDFLLGLLNEFAVLHVCLLVDTVLTPFLLCFSLLHVCHVPRLLGRLLSQCELRHERRPIYIVLQLRLGLQQRAVVHSFIQSLLRDLFFLFELLEVRLVFVRASLLM
jgi:hypothetical protein